MLLIPSCRVAYSPTQCPEGGIKDKMYTQWTELSPVRRSRSRPDYCRRQRDGTGCMYHHRFWCFTDRTSSSHMSVVLTGVVLSPWLFTLIFRRLLSSQNVKMIRITLSVIVTPCRTCSFRQMFVELCLTHLQVQVSFTTNVVP